MAALARILEKLRFAEGTDGERAPFSGRVLTRLLLTRKIGPKAIALLGN